MIDSFMGDYRWLSNFHEAPIEYGGRTFRNSEGAYQAQKFIEDAQMNVSPWQFEALSGKDAKKLAKENKPYIRPGWQDMSLRVMSEVLHAKFSQNKDLRTLLAATYPHVLVESNSWHDEFYGVCRCMGKKPGCGEGLGQNWLGRLLMAERSYWLDLAIRRDENA